MWVEGGVLCVHRDTTDYWSLVPGTLQTTGRLWLSWVCMYMFTTREGRAGRSSADIQLCESYKRVRLADLHCEL